MKKVLTFLSFVLLNLYSVGQSGLQKITDSIGITTDIGKPFDRDYLKTDIIQNRNASNLPISSFNFPVQKYMGSAGVREMEIKDKKFYGVDFSVGNQDKFKNLFNKDTISLYQDFFVLLCYSAITDSMGEKVSSRNFPDYITGQGYINTETCKIDYTTFIDFTGKSYAIINEKVFDLTVNGKVIILVPKNDGSLNFIQMKTPYIRYSDANSYSDANNYYRGLFEKSEIKSLINLAKQSKQ